jgi:hypothetical protein
MDPLAHSKPAAARVLDKAGPRIRHDDALATVSTDKTTHDVPLSVVHKHSSLIPHSSLSAL